SRLRRLGREPPVEDPDASPREASRRPMSRHDLGAAGPLLKRTLAYLRPHSARFGTGVGLTLAGIALDLVKPLPLALVLDSILGSKPHPEFIAPYVAGLSPIALLALAAAAIIVLTVARGLVTMASNSITIQVGQRMVNDLRTDIYAHLQKLSLRFHHRQQTGDLPSPGMADTL